MTLIALSMKEPWLLKAQNSVVKLVKELWNNQKSYSLDLVPLPGKYLPEKLRETCEALANHVSNATYEQVSIQRMVAYFKIDEKEKIYFLWTGSIRLNEVSKYQRRSRFYINKPICLEPGVKVSSK